MKTRQLWWQCTHNHQGCVNGKLGNTKEELGRMLVDVERTHFNRNPLCVAETLRIAPKRSLLDNVGAALEWRIDHDRIHLNLEQRLEARVLVGA